MLRIFLIFLLLNIRTINPISPPTFSEDFDTNYDLIFKNSSTTIRYSGKYAEDNANKLFTQVITFPDHSMRQVLYNKAFYPIERNANGKITDCLCLNTSYEKVGLPIFHLHQHLEIYEQNDTDIFWKVIGNSIPAWMTMLFRVKKDSPNIPAEVIVLVREQYPSLESVNITFIGFKPSQPNKNLFAIPEECTKVECNSPHSLQAVSPFIFDKWYEDERWFF